MSQKDQRMGGWKEPWQSPKAGDEFSLQLLVEKVNQPVGDVLRQSVRLPVIPAATEGAGELPPSAVERYQWFDPANRSRFREYSEAAALFSDWGVEPQRSRYVLTAADILRRDILERVAQLIKQEFGYAGVIRNTAELQARFKQGRIIDLQFYQPMLPLPAVRVIAFLQGQGFPIKRFYIAEPDNLNGVDWCDLDRLERFFLVCLLGYWFIDVFAWRQAALNAPARG